MKILYVITKSNWGGAQKYVYDLASSLQKNHEIIVVHGGKGILCEKLDSIGVKRIKLDTLDRDINFFGEIKVFKKLIDIFNYEKPDIVHLNSSKIGGLGSLAGRIASWRLIQKPLPKIIFTAHGLPFNEDRAVWQKIIIKFLTYITILLTHKTILISKKELRQVKKWAFISNKVFLIYNGISKINYVERGEAQKFLLKKVRVSNTLKKDNLWVGTISELTKNKGLKYGIKAIKKLKENIEDRQDIIFIIIGNGEDKNYLENLIKKEGLENNVFLTGFIEDAQKYLKAFDIFLLSSVKEGLPYVLLEAGQAGNAIISTNVGGVEEIIDNDENGILVKSKNKKEIARGLKTYINDSKKIKKFGNKIQTKIKEKFNKKRMVSETIKLYLSNKKI